MADEISVNISISANRDEFAYNKDLSAQFDGLASKKAGNPASIDVTTNKATASFGAISAPRYITFKNNGTNIIELTAGTTTHQIAYLRAGDVGGLPINTSFVLGHISYSGPSILQIEAVSE